MESVSDGVFIQQIIDGSISLLTLGGPVVGILLAASIFGFALALVKFSQFYSTSNQKLKNLYDAVEYWQAGKQQQAIEILDGSSLAIAKDLRFGLEQITSMDSDSLHDEMLRRGTGYLRSYSKGLRLLELIYNLAPVLGLLGTVLGMIDAFRGLAVSAGSGGGNALASGIWEALLTTAVGLSIAIFFAVIHVLLVSKLELLTDEISNIVAHLFNVSIEKA